MFVDVDFEWQVILFLPYSFFLEFPELHMLEELRKMIYSKTFYNNSKLNEM